MNHLFTLCIVLTLCVAIGRSQLLQQKENCKSFSDPVNCNAYYQRCVDNIIVHKFCPIGMEWNRQEDMCENSERCRNEKRFSDDIEGKNETKFTDSEYENDLTFKGVKPLRPRPPIVRPPGSGGSGGSNGAVEVKLNILFYMLLLLKLVL